MKMNWGRAHLLFKALFNKAATELLLWVAELDPVADEIESKSHLPAGSW